MDRCYRIGQKKSVRVIRYCCKNSGTKISENPGGQTTFSKRFYAAADSRRDVKND